MPRIVKTTVAAASAKAVDPRLEAARAEHKARRAKATVTPVEPIEPVHTPDEEQDVEGLAARAQAAFDELLTKLGAASPKRYLASFLIGCCVSFGTGYLLGKLVFAMAVGTMLLTTSAFLGWLVMLVGTLVAIWAGYKAGGVAFDYIVTKRVDAHWHKLRDSVGSLFKREPKPVVAAA